MKDNKEDELLALFHQGNACLVDEEFEDSIKYYSEVVDSAMTELPPDKRSKLFLNRATAWLHMKKFNESLEDLNKSLELDPMQELALYRKGLVYFELEEFESAKAAFSQGLRQQQLAVGTESLNTGKGSRARRSASYLRFIRKCDAALADEMQQLPAAVSSVESSPKAIDSVGTAPAATSASSNAPSAAAAAPIRYQYYQSTASMSISVLAKNLTSDEVSVDISASHLKVAVKRAGGQSEEIVIDKELFGFVDVERSNFAIFKTKVEITLQKVAHEMWPAIELPPGAVRTSAAPAASASVAATAAPIAVAVATEQRPKPYASARDWNKVEAEISQELEAEKPEGEEALQKLFQQIYKDADPETRMAMKKSFQTSGGTVLSTNWKEVKQKDYESEKQAPKGMEWRSWEGEKLKQVED